MDLNLIEQLISLVNKSTLACLEIEEEGLRVRLENQAPSTEVRSVFPDSLSASPVSPSTQTAAVPPSHESSPADLDENVLYVKSPLVGTYHSTQALGYDPLELGSTVAAGQALCAVEAMKLMNVIEAEFAGEILEFMVEDGALVEYGQNLVKIRKP